MITVRAMQVKDAEQVSELERMIFSQPWSYQGFVDSLSLPNTVFLVAEENNKILGYIGMYLSIDEGEITNVAVSPEMRCHGIGGMLLAEAKKEFSDGERITALQQIHQCIEQFDLDGVDQIMEQLEEYQVPECIRESMDQLRVYVADVSLEEIMELTDTMTGLLRD